MKVKTYIFEDIKDGIERIKEEYGADTIILDIKNTSKNSRKSCEISIGLDDPELEENNEGALRKKTEEIWSHTTKLLSEKIIDLELEIVRDRVKQYPLSLKVFFEKMRKNGFDIHLAVSMISEIYGEIGMLANDIAKANYFFRNAIAKRIKIYDIINSNEHILMLGPTGAGKTQTAKKLSKMLSNMGKDVSILAYDPARKGCWDEHVIFSESYGIPFSFAVSEEDLFLKIAKDRTRKIIDISGYIDLQKRLAGRLKDIKKIILLPAGARDEKIRNYCNRFNDSNIAGLVFTKLDEEETLGHICHNLILLEQPVCCLTTGMGIGDVLTPNHETFCKILLEGNIWKTGEKRLLQ
jgi:flagellar biosynthesis protein FlhF